MTKTTLSLIAGAGMLVAGTAHASLVYVAPNTDLTAAPSTISFGGSLATYTIAYFGADPYDLTFTADTVSTGGTGMVSTSFGGPTGFQVGTDVQAESGQFAAYPTATGIPYSLADVFIGIAFTLADGLHYGAIEVNNNILVSYAYDNTPNTTVITGNVPEPATLAVLASGLLGLGMIRRRARD